MANPSTKADIQDLEESLAAYRDANRRGGNWETHRAEVVIEQTLQRARELGQREERVQTVFRPQAAR